MENELEAVTEPGRVLVVLAEWHAENFSAHADCYDRNGEFPQANVDALRQSGFLAAPAPESAGGMGVESVHDLMLASSRLARGDASTTLGVNMHLLVYHALSRQLVVARNRGDEAREEVLLATLQRLIAGGAFIAAAVSEPDQDLHRPAATAVLDEGSWRISGRKIICSGAPGATHFSVAVTVTEGEEERYAYAMVPRSAAGVSVLDDWDALGMRASGSTSVVFDNVNLGSRGPGKGFPAGVISTGFLEQNLSYGAAHAAASLGVAEAAHQASLTAVCKKHRSSPGSTPRGFVQERAAENSIELAAARAIFSRSLLMVDRHYAANPTGGASLSEVSAVFAEVQRAKAFINSAAVRIADRAMAMVGGAGYANSSPLARHYRDARAGAFMHPLGSNVAIEYLGAHTLGLRPERF
jgi:alkylation response protein AidB-like acyl-CoA dehydrogenase